MRGPKRRCRGTPVVVTADGENRLERITLGGVHSEAWLQKLMHDHPSALPIHMIEPAFGDPIAIACEMPCAAGFIDNLFLTPTGEIILVEAKLWRNAELRRKVVAQALDYVAALTRLDYPAFEAMILHGCKLKAPSLHALVADHPDAYDEPEFIDAIARNLKQGRMLVMAVAEGIREETESLVGLLQSHAGAHFTFALVELGCWRDERTGDIVVVPDTLAQTVLIERGIVVIEGGVPKILPSAPGKAATKPHSLSAEMFYEELAKRDPALPNAIQAFIKKVEPLGVYPDQRATLGIKANHPDGHKPISLGFIDKTGKLWTDAVATTVPANIARRYTRRLADLIGGQLSGSDGLAVTTNGSSAPLVSQLLPEHAEAWADAMQSLLAEVSKQSEHAA
ncbi:hypothetical protein [Rhizorhabdus dicambivorans]|uniref:DUF91 domain-containing protein n=1 Tax=Rhizorhabdus dicambivorans TaxID=1850238 RepID=A0A2A4FYF3_9SPHN|nr:hypothetical protein [Rhizorhabdus dicambivorans]ATE64194.1 hypothetical protein CMV14_07145 [Rhizorhabdus dicambivorans]PCE42534.1 hypothetical protein COO09_08935 [Rhizorhabdus dicambivorans]